MAEWKAHYSASMKAADGTEHKYETSRDIVLWHVDEDGYAVGYVSGDDGRYVNAYLSRADRSAAGDFEYYDRVDAACEFEHWLRELGDREKKDLARNDPNAWVERSVIELELTTGRRFICQPSESTPPPGSIGLDVLRCERLEDVPPEPDAYVYSTIYVRPDAIAAVRTTYLEGGNPVGANQEKASDRP